MTSPQHQNLTMMRAARVRLRAYGFSPELRPVVACWGRDCHFEFGVFSEKGFSLWDFVWSREERLYLVPREWAESVKMGVRQERQMDREEIWKIAPKAEQIRKAHGHQKTMRYLKQVGAEHNAQRDKRELFLPADGRQVRAKCPLCRKVSILSLDPSIGALPNDADGKDNGHLKRAPRRPLEPP